MAFLATPIAAQETIAGKTEVIGCAIQKIAVHTVKLAGALPLPTDLVRCIKKDNSCNCCKLALKALYGMVRGQEIVYMLTGSDEGNSIAGLLSINENLVVAGRVIAAPNSEARIQRAAKAAKHFNEGLWEGKFPPPGTWYKKQQIPQ